MAKVSFTGHLQRHLAIEPVTVTGTTLAEVLNEVFQRYPALRTYLLDDQRGLRQHVAIFIDGEQIRDRRHFSDLTPQNAEVFVAQALSGG